MLDNKTLRMLEKLNGGSFIVLCNYCESCTINRFLYRVPDRRIRITDIKEFFQRGKVKVGATHKLSGLAIWKGFNAVLDLKTMSVDPDNLEK